MIKKSIFILIFSFLFTACVERGDTLTTPKNITHKITNKYVIKIDSNISTQDDQSIPTLVVRNKKPTNTVANKLSGTLILIIGIALLF